MTSQNQYNVTVGFSTTNKWASRAIRWAIRDSRGWSLISHAWIAYDDPALQVRLVLEAEWYGFRPTQWDIWKKRNILMAEFRPLRLNTTPGLELLGRSIGLKYDWMSAFWSGTWSWAGRWIRSRFQSPNKLMCSEGVIRYLQECGYDSMMHFNPEVTHPLRILRRCLEVDVDFELLKVHPEITKRYR